MNVTGIYSEIFGLHKFRQNIYSLQTKIYSLYTPDKFTANSFVT